VVAVEDDGRGLDGTRLPQLGLLGMRERVTALGGKLEVGAGSQGGTRVEATMPLEARA
jgi:signal transduction histidine kinase